MQRQTEKETHHDLYVESKEAPRKRSDSLTEAENGEGELKKID